MDLSPEQIYFNERMPRYGITSVDDPANQVKLRQTGKDGNTEEVNTPIFTVVSDDKFPGIGIMLYTLQRNRVNYKPEGSRWSKNYQIVRLVNPTTDAKGKEKKYHIPKGAGTYPFFPPHILDKFEQKQEIKTLVLTEGYFKAFKAGLYGMDIIGLSSITHYKDKEKGTLHDDILTLIKTCNVQNVIWLADGDCNRVSLKALDTGDDIYRRPNQFYNSCKQIHELLKDHNVCIYFAHVDTLQFENQPKGLDDLLIDQEGKEAEIVADLVSLSKPCSYFYRAEVTHNTVRIRHYFNLHDINHFVNYHDDILCKLSGHRPSALKQKEFTWNGTKYRWNSEKDECEMLIPGDSKKYFRVGDQYHEKVSVPNKYGELERTFHRRQKSTIDFDYGKDFCKHIPKYTAFCNVPDHSNYQEVIHNCYNMYYPFEHEPEEGDYEYTLQFLKHIFGDKEISVHHPEKGPIKVNELDLGLDYIQLLYQRPQQILPILCLVSKEQGTGKTTFAKWLKQLFTQNVAIVGNAELANEFNASWAGKLLVICDEAKIDKQVVVERVKSLSTGDKIFMNAKGKDHVEIDFFAKFLFMTNNEENFIYAGDDDVRYWIRKVPVISKLFVGLIESMKDEIPAFLHFINSRKLATECLHRAWFYPELIKTEALKKVVAFSKSTVEKEMRERIRSMFFDHGDTEILMSLDAINEEFFRNKYERNYLRNVLRDQLKVELYHEFMYNNQLYKTMQELTRTVGEVAPEQIKKVEKQTRHSWPKWERIVKDNSPERVRVYVKDNGRPYVFKREQFLTADELANLYVDPETADAARTNSNKKHTLPEPAQMNAFPGNQEEDLPF